MSPQRKRAIAEWITILLTLATFVGTAAAFARTSVDALLERKLDVARYERDQVADSAWKAEMHGIVLDALCARTVDPHNRRCR